MASIYTAQGDNLDEALALALKAQELAPNNGNILDTLGFIHYQRGQYRKAMPLLTKATEILGNDAMIFYHLGLTYAKLDRRDDAVRALGKALQLQETIPQAAEIRALIAELKK